MDSALSGIPTKNTSNLTKGGKELLARELNDFLEEFTDRPQDSPTYAAGDNNDALRAKVDAIAQRIRHSTTSNMSDGQQGGQQPQNPIEPVVDPNTRQNEEVPVKERLSNLEVIVREIRDNMKQAVTPPVQTGQAQPREEPLRLPSPASDWRRRQLHEPVVQGINDNRRNHKEKLQSHPSYAAQPYRLEEQIEEHGNPAYGPRYPGQYTQHQPRRAPHSAPRHSKTVKPRDRNRHTAKRPRPTEATSGYTSSSSESESGTDIDNRQRRDDPTDRRLINLAISRQYQHMGHSTGRVLDITPPLVRPHEALPPDMKRKVKERTKKKNRRDLTLQEYVCGYSRMLMTEMDPATDLYAMIEHLSQVAQDAAVAPWPAVRLWTTTCLDYLDDGHVTWRDTYLFRDDRSRLVWSQVGQNSNATPVPCPAYNNDVCKQPAPHMDGEMRLLHTCAICYYAAPTAQRSESSTHNAKTCNRRRRQGGRDEWEHTTKQPYKRHLQASQPTIGGEKEADQKPKN